MSNSLRALVVAAIVSLSIVYGVVLAFSTQAANALATGYIALVVTLLLINSMGKTR